MGYGGLRRLQDCRAPAINKIDVDLKKTTTASTACYRRGRDGPGDRRNASLIQRAEGLFGKDHVIDYTRGSGSRNRLSKIVVSAVGGALYEVILLTIPLL